MRSHGRELVQSLLAFVAAFTLTVLWHELGHGLTATALGYSPVVYSGHEEDPASTVRDSVLIAGAGPLLSLVTGSVLLAVARRRTPGVRPGSLLLTWLGLLGTETFAGYLLTAPFFAAGDVGKILQELRVSDPVVVAVAVVGLFGVLVVARLAVEEFARLMPAAPDRPTDLRLFLRQVAVLPWLLGSAVVVLVSLPLDSPFGPLAVATSGLFTLVAMGLTAGRFPSLRRLGGRTSQYGLVLLAVVTVAALLLDRLVFRSGLHL